jgi:hypothetical protein
MCADICSCVVIVLTRSTGWGAAAVALLTSGLCWIGARHTAVRPFLLSLHVYICRREVSLLLLLGPSVFHPAPRLSPMHKLPPTTTTLDIHNNNTRRSDIDLDRLNQHRQRCRRRRTWDESESKEDDTRQPFLSLWRHSWPRLYHHKYTPPPVPNRHTHFNRRWKGKRHFLIADRCRGDNGIWNKIKNRCVIEHWTNMSGTEESKLSSYLLEGESRTEPHPFFCVCVCPNKPTSVTWSGADLFEHGLLPSIPPSLLLSRDRVNRSGSHRFSFDDDRTIPPAGIGAPKTFTANRNHVTQSRSFTPHPLSSWRESQHSREFGGLWI